MRKYEPFGTTKDIGNFYDEFEYEFERSCFGGFHGSVYDGAVHAIGVYVKPYAKTTKDFPFNGSFSPKLRYGNDFDTLQEREKKTIFGESKETKFGKANGMKSSKSEVKGTESSKMKQWISLNHLKRKVRRDCIRREMKEKVVE